MTSNNPEQTIISTSFGTVTSKRVTYMYNKGWFSGGKREDVPLKQVASVRHETERKIFLGLFYIVLGLVLIAVVIGIIPLVFGIFLLWGSPKVNIVTTGGSTAPVIGWPWQNQEAQSFADAVRGQLFSE
ncbi:hypothetical protein [Chamaesiphon polymorphus]|uniref:Uncharacterized protein n=1 Tax=Chamaesiphon polymorphus CCALA 037 TaxID=2107692 RepID=A0A2T1G8A3_9CYAN|nr:hypothetical protein [Chamaesiphon polymorphus]PSB53471.1 hypothetical protein C7B77_19515 [Chamaesiphon polymorphus CCALA 037]